MRRVGYVEPRLVGGLAALSAVLMATSPSAAVHLRAQITRVGYSGSSSGNFTSAGDVYRIGRWVPVCVEVANEDGDQFEGTIEVRQTDADGDEVVARKDVAVRGLRTFCLYVPGGPVLEDNFVRGMGYEGPAPFTVRIFDQEGKLAAVHGDSGQPVKELRPPRQVVPAPPNALVILDMSSPPVNHLDRLKDLERVQEVMILRCSPRDVPDSVVGLELVDVLVWDAPQPDSLDPLQNSAILEWLRRGGRLILGVGKTWNNIAQSQFGGVLPAKLGETQSTTSPEMLGELLPSGDSDGESPAQIPQLTYCPLTTEQLASDAVPVLPRGPKPGEQVWAVRRSCGRGEVLLVPAELKEVLSLRAKDERLTFLRTTLLRLRSTTDARDAMVNFAPTDLFSRVAAQTAFQATSGLYFAFAFAFVIAYIILVTGGVWGWLRRKGGVRHAWVASAMLAAGASGVSLGAVQLVRVFGQGVHEMTIVDGAAGSYDAIATSYLGLKTSSHTLVDVCVPQRYAAPTEAPDARGSLRPYSVEVDAEQRTTFAVPQRYEGVAQLGELRSVPLRATLKQFEVTWRGSLDGRLAASLRARTGSNELDPSSWVKNELGSNLRDCYLFARSPGQSGIDVYLIGTLENGETRDWVKVCRVMEEQHKERASQFGSIRDRVENLGSEGEKSRWSPPLVRVLLDQCLRELSIRSVRDSNEIRREQPLILPGAAPYVAPLILLSFYDDPALSGLLYPGQELRRTQGRDLELSSRLEPGTGLFVGFAESPGPLRLCRRKPGDDVQAWKTVTPSRAAVMYRFTAPIR